jgi:anti-sigma factor RsiW
LRHLSEDLLEAYVLGRATADDEALIEEHLLVCDECQGRLSREQRTITTLIASLPPNPSEVIATHKTKKGDVSFYVRRLPSRGWRASVVGPGAESGMILPSRERAEEYCRDTFRDLFPEHHCGPGCCVGIDAGSG